MTPTARTSTACLHGVSVRIPCPSWCITDHGEGEAFLEDVLHEGRPVALTAPVFDGTEQVLKARLTQYPFAGGSEAIPYLALDASGDGAIAELSPTEALAFADQLVAHAAVIRSLAEDLQGGAA